MPDIELKPDEYGERDPRTGLRKVKDDPRVQLFWVIACTLILVGLYFVRDQISTDSLFWGAVIFATGGGAFLWPILSRLDR